YFVQRGLKPNQSNLDQAMLPEAAEILPNLLGTASGMWFSQNNKVYVSLPGVPYELKSIVSDFVLPKLSEKFKLPVIVHKTVMTQGIGESNLMEIIADWEESLKAENIKLAYLPKPGMVRLRLSGIGKKEDRIAER